MPYIKDKNNEEKYIPSKYAKEELPTWNECYNEFYKGRVFSYDPLDESHQEIDLYWKLPHRKLLLGWVCNQLNKMLFEDGMKPDILKFINDKFDKTSEPPIDVHFIIQDHIPGSYEIDEMVYHELPLIYTCEIPSTNKRSIFASNRPAKNIKEFTNKIFIQIVIRYGLNTFIIANECNIYNNIFDAVITELMKDIIKYFEGECVGWKDGNGQLLDGVHEIKSGCEYQAGIDAAR